MIITYSTRILHTEMMKHGMRKVLRSMDDARFCHDVASCYKCLSLPCNVLCLCGEAFL